MNAAETSASSAIADWTPLTVVSRSSTTAEIDTFISDVSTTSTNMAIASSTATRPLPASSPVTSGPDTSVTGDGSGSDASSPWPSSTPPSSTVDPHVRGFPFALAVVGAMVHGTRVTAPHPAGGGSDGARLAASGGPRTYLGTFVMVRATSAASAREFTSSLR